MRNTASAPMNCRAKVRSEKAAFQDCFKFERKLGNLGSEISAKKQQDEEDLKNYGHCS